MIKKEIAIDGRLVPFRASATVPRLYRKYFQRDIFKDLIKLEKSVKRKQENEDENEESESDISIEDLEIFENVAFIMAKHGNPSLPDTPEEWLDEFDTFSIYAVLPELLELWGMNMKQDSVAKKNRNQQAEK